jgi:hypothetical protein
LKAGSDLEKSVLMDLEAIRQKIKKPMRAHHDKHKWVPIASETFEVEESEFTIRLYYNQVVPEMDALKVTKFFLTQYLGPCW